MKLYQKNIGRLIATIFILSSLFPYVVNAYVSVKGYTKKNGTYVAPHVRSNPNGLKSDNYGYKPSQGVYNPSYGTKGPEWNTPTYITDPNYYEGKSIYDSTHSGGSASVISGSSILQYQEPKVTAPANATIYGSSWYCNNGYRQSGNFCIKVTAPPNATIYGSSWYCDSGFKQVGNSCQKAIVPTNATIYGSTWYCNSGYRQVSNTCEKVISPENSTIYGSVWYCNSGYKKVGNSCVVR